MKASIDKVAEFQKTTDSPILDKPAIPAVKRVRLRIALLDEELCELEEAAQKKDITAVLDALCDLQYILNGTILEFGLQDVFEDAFQEVHSSNMSKFCKTTYEAQESCKKLQLSKQVDSYYKLINGLHVIFRSSDDKILKGINFFEPRLKQILEQSLSPEKRD
jgi:predicted HAD superfamily Cof-like phosphohydrolase